MSLAALLAAAGTATAAVALPHSPTERARLFADCAGRLLAEEEHLRLSDGAASETAAARRAAFLDLLDAVLPDARQGGLPDRAALHGRVGARAAQAALLSRAAFAADPLARAPARDAAGARIAACLRLLPGA